MSVTRSPAGQDASRRQIALWLLLCCGLVYGMVVLGGVTRLTGSGLSMVDWRPVTGVLPPLSERAWQEELAAYQQFPEYQKKNYGMDVAAFKRIFWFEYAHRMLGRLIGLVFLLPFLYFLLRRRFQRAMLPKLIAMFLLGGLQGLLGWYMVKSGLVHDPEVSQYRLTAHLLAAFLIYAYMLWVALDLLFPLRPVSERPPPGLRRHALVATGLVALTVASGGFVAGLKAGHAYNSFPLMAGRWIPEGVLHLRPAWRNLFENVATVQFDHRVLALLVLATVLSLWLRARGQPLPQRARWGLHALLGATFLQVALGISTLLLYVPIGLASAHQAGAMLLFTASLFVNHALREAPAEARATGGMALA